MDGQTRGRSARGADRALGTNSFRGVEVLPVIRASVRAGLLGETVEHIDLPIELARTPRVLLERFASKLPKSFSTSECSSNPFRIRHA